MWIKVDNIYWTKTKKQNYLDFDFGVNKIAFGFFCIIFLLYFLG